MKFYRSALVILASLALHATGCQSDKPEMETSPNRAIPRGAVYAKQGAGRLWFQASDPGVAYIYDADTTQLVFATQMQKNQRLVIEPTKARATVEGKPVYEQPMQRNHTHRIYFEPFGKLPPPEKPPEPLTLSPKPSTAPATSP